MNPPNDPERGGRHTPGVSVILPVHGNAATLPEMVRRLRTCLPDRPLQILMVDDASPDDSLAVMRGLGAEVVALSQRTGQNGAILAGLGLATQPYTCALDADLQDPPEGLVPMLARLEEGAVHVVFSTREGFRRASSNLFRWVIRRLFPSLPYHPCLCFALDEEARQAVLAAASRDDYLVAVIGALGLPADSVRVWREPRPEGRSAYSAPGRLHYALRMLASAVRLRVFRARIASTLSPSPRRSSTARPPRSA